jgi:hypothetical protein
MASRERRESGVLVLMTAAERERLHSLAALLGVSSADVVRSLEGLRGEVENGYKGAAPRRDQRPEP